MGDKATMLRDMRELLDSYEKFNNRVEKLEEEGVITKGLKEQVVDEARNVTNQAKAFQTFYESKPELHSDPEVERLIDEMTDMGNYTREIVRTLNNLPIATGGRRRKNRKTRKANKKRRSTRRKRA